MHDMLANYEKKSSTVHPTIKYSLTNQVYVSQKQYFMPCSESDSEVALVFLHVHSWKRHINRTFEFLMSHYLALHKEESVYHHLPL